MAQSRLSGKISPGFDNINFLFAIVLQMDFMMTIEDIGKEWLNG